MGFIRKIQLYFYERFLLQSLLHKKQPLARKLVNLKTATTIGILFDATEVDQRDEVLTYAQKLKKQGKKVQLLGFFNNKQDGDHFTFSHFNRSAFDWALRPKGEAVKDFISTPFDLLITLDTDAKLYAEYVAALSEAHLRVGPYTPKTYCYDLMIDAGPKTKLSFFIKQMELLLQRTNTKNEAA